MLVELVALFADVLDPGRDHRRIDKQAARPRLARQAVGSGELALQMEIMRLDQVGVGLRCEVNPRFIESVLGRLPVDEATALAGRLAADG
jgi:hypothetical protein